jgi:FkbM family methyltransferase
MSLIFKILKKIRNSFFPTKHQRMVKKYFADGGDNKFRYSYLLNEKSIVFDIGGFNGQWSSEIFARYQSDIYVFEPVKSFYISIRDRFQSNPKIKVFNFGIGAVKREEQINLLADGSSIYIKGGKFENITIISFIDFVSEQKINKIDLIKINIEGGEYELLEGILNSGQILNIDNIQIQFHNIFPEAYDRMVKIQTQLALTHSLTYQYLFVWENWERLKN